MELLEQAIESIKQGKTPQPDKPLRHGAEINLRVPSLIPDDYLPDVHNRLILYKRIANAADFDALRELQVEMIDRFGLLPAPAKNLFRITQLKLMAQQRGIAKLDAGQTNGRIEFESDTPVDPMKIIELVQNQPQRYRLEGGNKLKFTQEMTTNEQRFEAIEQILQQLSNAQ
jgi:transcription-repair coupling factor (superfamily II helicase)